MLRGAGKTPYKCVFCFVFLFPQVESDEKKLRQEISYAIRNIHGIRCSVVASSLRVCFFLFVGFFWPCGGVLIVALSFVRVCLQEGPVHPRHGFRDHREEADFQAEGAVRQVCRHGHPAADEHGVPVCEQGISAEPLRCRHVRFPLNLFPFFPSAAQILPRAAGANGENCSD